jgi:hypothetical protein
MIPARVPHAALERALGQGLPTGSQRAVAHELAARLRAGLGLVEVRHFPIPITWEALAVRRGGVWGVEVVIALDTLDLRDGSPRRQTFGAPANVGHLMPEAFCAMVRGLYLQAFAHELDEATRIAGRRVFHPHRRGR